MTNTVLSAKPEKHRSRQLPIIDCDIHNVISPGSLDPYLPDRWLRHHRTYGGRQHTGAVYPKGSPAAARADAAPPSALAPGADLEFMQHQHLDAMGVEFGVLNCLGGGSSQLNAEYGQRCAVRRTIGRSASGTKGTHASVAGSSSPWRMQSSQHEKSTGWRNTLPSYRCCWLPGRRPPWVIGDTGRSMRPRHVMGFPSECTSVADREAFRSPPPGGRPITWKTTP